MRVLRPDPRVLAFYDGRISGVSAHSTAPNWLDDGAYELGMASFALIDADDALIYDTHMSLRHARRVRRHVEAAGVRRIRVVLSHWHADHVAGNEVFEDCEIIACRRTGERLLEARGELEAGDPAIDPVVLPNRLYDEALTLEVGRLRVELRHFDIHSDDATVLRFEDGLLLAGDTLEDSLTYVAEPHRLERHLDDLGRLAAWGAARILPNHGDPGTIEAGGYDASLITATQRYVSRLLPASRDPASRALSAREFIADELREGWLRYFAPYEAVHARNLRVVAEATEGLPGSCGIASLPAKSGHGR